MKTHRLIAKISLFASLAALVVLANGCAFTNRNNTPLFNLIDDNLTPEKKWKRNLSYPITVPLGLAAVAVDACVIHPISEIDDAAEDTIDALWDDWDWDDEYITECASIPWRALGTPVVFTTVWFANSFFDIDNKARGETRRHYVEENTPQAKLDLAEARRLLESGNPEKAMAKLKLPMDVLQNADTNFIWIKAAYQSRQWDEFKSHLIGSVLKSRLKGKMNALLDEMDASDDPLIRFKSLQTRWECSWSDPRLKLKRAEIMIEGLADSDPVFRYSVLKLVEGRYWKRSGLPPKLVVDIKRIADEDPNALIRQYAKQILDKIGAI